MVEDDKPFKLNPLDKVAVEASWRPFIVTHWAPLAHYAWSQFLLEGRGAVTFDKKIVDEWSHGDGSPLNPLNVAFMRLSAIEASVAASVEGAQLGALPTRDPVSWLEIERTVREFDPEKGIVLLSIVSPLSRMGIEVSASPTPAEVYSAWKRTAN